MRPRVKAGLLWGVVGGLAFLVLIQGYALFVTLAIEIPIRVALSVAVGLVAAGATYTVEGWLARSERS